MNWLGEHWLDILGWGGSALLVFSLLQARVLRFRTYNLVACVILVVFNAAIGVWPMVGMNVVLALINIWFLVRLTRDRHDQAAFSVVEVGIDDHYLAHVLGVHGADVARFQPDFTWPAADPADHAFVVLRGDETVGVVLLDADGDVARVRLDYVTPRYRDFTPGEFVWRHSTVLRDLGLRRVVTPPGMVGAYYDRLGFRRDGDHWVLDL
ncbi:YgjV family protein [Nocardioides sp. SYSU D00038]|uniref:YgjV family protein n=1 Tax=Nocardioides sp. SYSU D00038 TaxID=2812554 RepID=UPI001967C723|nr:YgjV family protein [Nocardioides sp. SYSU D00038]